MIEVIKNRKTLVGTVKRRPRPLNRGLSTHSFLQIFQDLITGRLTNCSTVRSKSGQNLLKTPQTTFYGGRERTTKNFPFYFEPGLTPYDSTPGKNAII